MENGSKPPHFPLQFTYLNSTGELARHGISVEEEEIDEEEKRRKEKDMQSRARSRVRSRCAVESTTKTRGPEYNQNTRPKVRPKRATESKTK